MFIQKLSSHMIEDYFTVYSTRNNLSDR